MLRQETMDSSDLPAASIHVTAHEVAEAAATIELRRDASRPPADTIALGDAVDSLGLSTSPDELWTEIRQIRESSEQVQARKRAKRLRLTRVALVASLALNIFSWLGWNSATRNSPLSLVGARTVSVGGHTYPSSIYQRGSATIAEARQHGFPLLVSLDDLRALSLNADSEARTKEYPVQEYRASTSQVWRLYALYDGIYVRGWKVAGKEIRHGQTVTPIEAGTYFSHRVTDDAIQRSVPLAEFAAIRDPDYVVSHWTVEQTSHDESQGHAEGIRADALKPVPTQRTRHIAARSENE